MHFPSWAPANLCELLQRRKEASPRVGAFDVEADVRRIQDEHQISEEEVDSLRASIWRYHPFLPAAEGDKLMERLLSSPQMKDVWAALGKRATSDRYAINFWQVCDSTVCAWRGNPKLSPTKRRALLAKIREHATELSALMAVSEDFYRYSITHLITDEGTEWFMDAMDAIGPFEDQKQNIDYAKFSISEIVPRFYDVIEDIKKKADESAKLVPVVRKPQSKNSEIHHFVRVLSGYLQREYGQPLHDAVALTTCTVFERDDIDSDYVRKLVSE